MTVPYVPVRWHKDEKPSEDSLDNVEKQAGVLQLINLYRVRGHLIANLDPLKAKPPQMHPELDPASYGFTIWDLERRFVTGGLAGQRELPLGEILHILRDAYCRTGTVEYMHNAQTDEKQWIQEHVEGVPQELPKDDQLQILHKLNEAEAFERFLHNKYTGHKRFSLEGGESLIPMLDAVLDEAADAGMEGTVIGMSHRGRLNVLANTVGKSYGEIFGEFEGNLDPTLTQGSGDVKYHLGAVGKHVARSGKEVRVEVASNPSHLEAVNPVVEGIARAKQDLLDRGEEAPVLPILIHGDAAFAGQGVVAETLNLSAAARLPHRRHRPHRGQQPGRVHHQPRLRPLLHLRHRRGQDDPGAHLPRERRRPRGLRAGGPPGLRVPPGVQEGRRHRHGGATGATATTRPTSRRSPSR